MTELKTLVEFMRANGVLHLKQNGVELTLDPEYQAPVSEVKSEGAVRIEPPPRRKDGLTPEQQIETYGYEIED